MKSLRKYIAESEQAYSKPVAGDYFAINIREETLFETYVCDETPDGIVIYADEVGMQLLEDYGYLGETLSEAHDFEIDSDEDSVDVVDRGEYDQEGDMAKDDLETIVRAARRLTGMLDDNENMPEWVQSKINKAADYVDTAADYIESNKQRAQGVAEGKDEKIAQLKKDYKTAMHWSENARSPQEREEYRRKALKIKNHLEKQYKQGVAEGMAGMDDAEPYTIGGAVDKQYVYTVMRDGKSMGIYHSLDDAKRIVANNKRINQYSKFKIQRKPRSKMAGPVGQLPEQGVAEGQTPEQEIELLKLRQNAEHGRAPLRRQAATQARIRELEKQIKDKQGMAEGLEKNLSVQQLATISDEALDKAYGYGRSNPGNTFGWQANLMSAAYAKKMIDAGVTDIEKISDAIHKGWNVTAQKFVQNPDQFDDTEKLRQAGKLEAKLAQRAKLMKINYGQLDNEEQEKDRVVARALLKAIKGQQGVAEGEDDLVDLGPALRNLTGEFNKFMKHDDRIKTDPAYAKKWNKRYAKYAGNNDHSIYDDPDDDKEQGVAEGGMDEAKYQGREVPLGKPMAGDVKKSKVYVRGPKGNVVKVNFGQKGMKIKKSIPGRRKNFRARHNCDNPGPRWKARYWSCRAW